MYDLRKIQDIMVIQLFGEISSMEKEKISKLIDSVISYGSRKIIFDFAEVSHLHHRTALDLCEKVNGFKKLGIEFTISGPQKNVKDVMIFTRMNQDLDIFDHINHALLNFTSRQNFSLADSDDQSFKTKNYIDNDEIKYLRH